MQAGKVAAQEAAMTSVVFMNPLSTVLWNNPMACPSSCTAVRKYGAAAAPNRTLFTVPQGLALGMTQ